ncbi:NAD(P)-binding domain-containing protein [Spongisporangium articulatum]|uniref:NAD(P)-binding domain-containing protein n=1 Tax=Spongisporangium articulatum TaxID=3362603 RepID=A0ABW8AT99_9ACTN
MSLPASLPVAVIGAGPVGLAAAAQLHERGLPFVVLEAGDGPGAAVREWSHVRFFSPWRFSTDAAARRLLEPTGWQEPPAEDLPTGADLVARYLRPLAEHPALAPHIRYGARVTGIAREGLDRVRTADRDGVPFLVRLEDESELLARAVIDATGTWFTPNPLGANGLPARGERALAGRLDPAMPDVLGADRGLFAGRHTLVVGAGHSAANTLLSLAELAQAEPGTRITWALRRDSADKAFGGETADELPARGELGHELHRLVDAGQAEVVTGFHAVAVHEQDGRLLVTGRAPGGDTSTERTLAADRVVVATGFRADFSFATELRIDLDPILESTRDLAPLIDPNEHSCGTVPPHGVDQLTHPETGYYAVGMKSYGRAPTFLLATGYEQVRSVTAALAGDWGEARDVQLDLPETGVCCADPIPEPVSLGTPSHAAVIAVGTNLLTVGAARTDGRCCG